MMSNILHPYWYVWGSMIQRCTNPKHPSYPRYGGRGITVCERWRNITNFDNDMGPKPFDGASIERVNNNDGYHPGNCIWADSKMQAANKNHQLGESGYEGVTKNKKGWSARFYDPYGDKATPYNIGTFDTPDEANDARLRFIAMYDISKPSS